LGARTVAMLSSFEKRVRRPGPIAQGTATIVSATSLRPSTHGTMLEVRRSSAGFEVLSALAALT